MSGSKRPRHANDPRVYASFCLRMFAHAFVGLLVLFFYLGTRAAFGAPAGWREALPFAAFFMTGAALLELQLRSIMSPSRWVRAAEVTRDALASMAVFFGVEMLLRILGS